MEYTWVAIFAGLLLGVGIISNAFSTIQVAEAASGSLYFHFTNVPALGQNVIIKLNGQSKNMQWREYLIPVLSGMYFEKYVSGFKNGEFLTACLLVIFGSSIKSSGCSSATFGGAAGTDFFLNLNPHPRKFN